MGLAGIDADCGQAQLHHTALKPDRKLATFMHDPLGSQRSVIEPTCHPLRISWRGALRHNFSIVINNTD
jgi:hypothetical protein